MKKYYFILAALAGITFWTCGDDDSEKTIPTIELSAPADNASVDLNTVANVSFSWKAAEGITGYNLLLSKSEDLSSPQEIAASANPLSVTADELNTKAASLGIAEGATDKIYWSVKAASGEANFQVRALTLTRKNAPTIALSDPADGVTIDVNTSTFPYTFRWTGVTGVPGYILRFTAGDKTEEEQIGEFTNRQYMSADDFDALLAKLGVQLNASATVSWTVLPSNGDSKIVTETRSFTGVRKILPLLSPENGSAYELNYKTPSDNATTFEWVAQSGVSSYTLLFSTSENMSNPISISVSGNKKTFTHSELQAIITNADYHLKRYLENKLYWNVSANGNMLTSAPNTVLVSGMKIFDDVRGSESIRYEVSVITYTDGSKGIWMSNNLKAKYYTDGSKMGEWVGDGGAGGNNTFVLGNGDFAYVQMCMDAPKFKSGDRSSFTGDPIPAKHIELMGVIYNHDPVDPWGGKFPQAFERVIPIGWRLAKASDFEKLYNAACAAPGGFNVLRNAEAFPDIEDKEHLNEWNMNFAYNGRFIWTFWGWSYETSWFYNVDREDGANNQGIWAWSCGDGGWGFMSDCTGAPVRVVYNGE